MKKVKFIVCILLIVIFIMPILPVQAITSTIASNKIITEEIAYTEPVGTTYKKFNPVVYTDNQYDYYITQSIVNGMPQFSVQRHNIVQNKNESLYTSKSNCKRIATYVKNQVIYIAYISNYDSKQTKYTQISMTKYDTVANKATEIGNFNTNYLIEDGNPSFAVDSKERFYFVTDYTNIVVFTTNNGKIQEYYRYKSGITDKLEIIINGISPNDKALLFYVYSPTKINEQCHGIQKLNDGKFVNEQNYTVAWGSLEDPNWQFIDNQGNYAVNQYGQLVKFNYNATTKTGIEYEIVQEFPRDILDYIKRTQDSNGVLSQVQENVPYTQVGNYTYLAGKDNLIYVINSSYQKAKKLNIGLPTDEENCLIERITNIDGTLYVRCCESDKKVVKVIKNVETKLEDFKNIVYSTHETQTHTKQEIKQKYESTVAYDYSKSFYSVQPQASAPYKAGALQTGVVNDTLNRINFYRWLYGVQNVTLNSAKMERNQKGAVLLSALKQLTHWPEKPNDMEDAFYEEGYAGCNVNNVQGDTYSGNCSRGTTYLYQAIDGYISDINNVTTENGAVGHRMSLLYPYATQTSFGECNTYTTLSMYYDFEDVGEKLPEAFYAYPSAGYFPLEQFYTNEYWSLYVTEDVNTTKDFKIQFKYNGQTYNATGIMLESGYSAIDFKMPDELIAKLGGSGKAMPDCDIEVLLTGLETMIGDNISYNYTVKFFSVKNVLTDFSFSENSVSIPEGYTKSLNLVYTPANAVIDEKAIWSSDNIAVVEVDGKGILTAKKQGEATITVTIEGITKKIKVTVTEKPPYKLGDVSGDGRINTLDVIMILQHISHKITLTDTQILAANTYKDSKENVINTLDAIKILQYISHKITEF